MPRAVRPEVSTARKLRREMSYPEVLLWQRLRGQATGARFRRQHPIGPYIADFYCAARHLVIEVDGQVHDGRARTDAERDRFFRENGYAMTRISASDICAMPTGWPYRSARSWHAPSTSLPPVPLPVSGRIRSNSWTS